MSQTCHVIVALDSHRIESAPRPTLGGAVAESAHGQGQN